MKIRLVTMAILGVLLVSPAQGMDAPKEQLPTVAEPVSLELQSEPLMIAQNVAPPRMQTPRSRRSTPPTLRPMQVAAQGPREVKILQLQYARAVDMATMIREVFGINAYFDQGSNSLIINATKEQLESIMRVVAEMDVPRLEESTAQPTQDLIYRIFMFEISAGDRGLKPFLLRLQTSVLVSMQELLDATADESLQITEFLQKNDAPPSPYSEMDGFGPGFEADAFGPGSETDVLIQGKAASNDALKRIADRFPDARITELKWDDDDTFTDSIAAAQRTQLPEQMQKHIRKFLGDDIRTVGYWFGNLSAPGEVQAPIGPWMLKLQLEMQSEGMMGLQVDVEMPETMGHMGRMGYSQPDEILSNTLSAKIGQPVIIGYNRESYGARKMGAMVIVPEAHSL